MGWDTPSFVLKKCRERLESIAALDPKACKIRIANKESWIYLLSQLHNLTDVIAYFFLSLSVGHFCCKSSKQSGGGL